MTKRIAIIGNGISGITAARHIRKMSNHEINVISGESEYFFSRTALMYVFMGHMKWEHIKPYEDFFWKKNRINLIHKWVQQIDTSSNTITFYDATVLQYDILIVATGSVPKKFGGPGENLIGVQGLYSKQDLENLTLLSAKASHAVVVGGGLIGIEAAEMLNSCGIGVTHLVRENSFWRTALPAPESEMISQHIIQHDIDLRCHTELQTINDDGTGNVKSVTTSTGEIVPCSIVVLTTGVQPNVEFIRGSSININKGIVVNRYLQSNVQNVFAIGDCAELEEPSPGRRKIEPVWYTGKLMGEVVARTICDMPTPYNPGIWYNSAKFFDIEYQTYGHIPANISHEYEWFYWQHAHENKAFRICYQKSNMATVGLSFYGLRARHSICNAWIENGTNVHTVITNLKKANFDPEFSIRYESSIANAWKQQPEMVQK